MQNTIRIVGIAILLFLTGCATHQAKPSQTNQVQRSYPSTATSKQDKTLAVNSKPTHLQKPAQLSHWQANGRLAATKGDKGGNAAFVWTQHGEHYQIKLFGPFGAGSVYVTGNQQQVEIREGNGKKTVARSAEEALQKKAGWTVPISGLHYWLVGSPIPNKPIRSQQRDSQGRLLALNQNGWIVSFEGYSDSADHALPSKIKLQNGQINVKIIVKSWKPLSAP